jgi:4a-hydroxytetrahydrobiopterin dehydratase
VTKRLPTSEQQIKKFLDQHSAWSVRDNKLHRDYMFPDFKLAFAFMTHIAAMAEQMNHHPEWLNVYNRVTVDLVTHDAHAITALDIELATAMEKHFLSRLN